METTTYSLYWDNEKEKRNYFIYSGSIGIIEKKLEATIV